MFFMSWAISDIWHWRFFIPSSRAIPGKLERNRRKAACTELHPNNCKRIILTHFNSQWESVYFTMQGHTNLSNVHLHSRDEATLLVEVIYVTEHWMIGTYLTLCIRTSFSPSFSTTAVTLMSLHFLHNLLSRRKKIGLLATKKWDYKSPKFNSPESKEELQAFA